MFDFVPLASYTNIHYYVLLLIAIVILIHALVYKIDDDKSIQFFNYLGYFVVCIYILYIGLRPVSGRYFGDMSSYARAYETLQSGATVIIKKDYVFNYFMAFCSKIMDVHTFFLLEDFLFIVPYVIFSKKYFGKYWFFALFMFLGSFLTWASGTNGLRNGLGTSLFVLGLYFYERKVIMFLFFIIGYFMHASIIIPIAAFIVSSIYKNPKAYIYIWLLSIPLSLAGGSLWTSFFANIGFAEDRTAGYLTGGSEEYNNQFSSTGFRWDFLIYSASAIFTGWYFIFKKNITDTFYLHIFGIYCIANAFWILVITAAFSNRFAYLSWFLMPVIIGYPMFRFKLWNDQYKICGVILFIYFMFTFIMNVR